uniref:Uncharacterized protein n=1 Tax=Glossina brevipalpis TaxID=37001 RepID=A0A1A9WHK7_9MUSC
MFGEIAMYLTISVAIVATILLILYCWLNLGRLRPCNCFASYHERCRQILGTGGDTCSCKGFGNNNLLLSLLKYFNAFSLFAFSALQGLQTPLNDSSSGFIATGTDLASFAVMVSFQNAITKLLLSEI